MLLFKPVSQHLAQPDQFSRWEKSGHSIVMVIIYVELSLDYSEANKNILN